MKAMIKGFVHAEKEPWEKEAQYAIYPFDMSKSSTRFVLVGEQDFEIDVPDGFDIRAGLVARLEKEKQSVLAAAQAKVTQIEGEIQSLLAIEA